MRLSEDKAFVMLVGFWVAPCTRNGLGGILRRCFGDRFIILGPPIFVEEVLIARNTNRILWFWAGHGIAVITIPVTIRARGVTGVSDHGRGIINVRVKCSSQGSILVQILVGIFSKRENNSAVCRSIIHGNMSGKRA